MGYRLEDLADRLQCEFRGNPDTQLSRVCTLQSGQPDALSFLANPRYRRYLADTNAGAVILAPDLADECPVACLLADDPYVVYAKAAQLLYATAPCQAGIDASASVSAEATVDASAAIAAHVIIESDVIIGPGVVVGPGSVIMRGSSIGADTRLVANVSVYPETQIGERVLVHAGAVLGSDGFGIANDKGRWVKLPQVGRVVIGDDVEIGANTTIDRGAVDDTVIEEGVKLDNQIQVAHNVHIGAHTAIAGCTAIAGSAKIGKHCMIGGAVGITGHLSITDHVTITAMSLVTKSIDRPGVYSSGMAAIPNEQWNKTAVRLRQLDKLARRVAALEKQLNKTES